jgi:F-type H+-transporting ATPase subunit b
MTEWFSVHLLNRRNVRYMMLSILPIITTASLAFAAGGEGEGSSREMFIDFAWRVANFVVLVGFLYWFLAKKIKEFFFERRQSIKATIDEKVAEKEETEKKFRGYSVKLDKATEEISNIFELIKSQGTVEKEKIIEDAKKAAEKMKEDAQTRMEQEFKAARNQLRAEAAKLSVEMAEEILKKNITQEHHEYMVKDYLDKVVKKH